jgi:hypothetical protein
MLRRGAARMAAVPDEKQKAGHSPGPRASHVRRSSQSEGGGAQRRRQHHSEKSAAKMAALPDEKKWEGDSVRSAKTLQRCQKPQRRQDAKAFFASWRLCGFSSSDCCDIPNPTARTDNK